MAVLNLRNVPDDLMRDLRKAAIDAGVPFHEHCIGLLKLALLHGLHIRVTATTPDFVTGFAAPDAPRIGPLDGLMYVTPMLDPPKPPREVSRPKELADLEPADRSLHVEIT